MAVTRELRSPLCTQLAVLIHDYLRRRSAVVALTMMTTVSAILGEIWD